MPKLVKFAVHHNEDARWSVAREIGFTLRIVSLWTQMTIFEKNEYSDGENPDNIYYD